MEGLLTQMTNWCEAKIRFPDFRSLGREVAIQVPQVIAATLQTQRALIFHSSGSYNGRPGWEPLKCRAGMPLLDSGTLSKSIGPKNSGKKPGRRTGTILRVNTKAVTIGTDIAYAAIQNSGGIIRPVRAKALRFKCFGQVVFARQVTIPARTFNDLTPEDVRELRLTVGNTIARVINRGGKT